MKWFAGVGIILGTLSFILLGYGIFHRTLLMTVMVDALMNYNSENSIWFALAWMGYSIIIPFVFSMSFFIGAYEEIRAGRK